MALGVGRKEMIMVSVLLVGVLLAVLNQTLLSPALPAIMADLQVDATTVQWLTSGYSLVEAVIIPLSAYLIGRFSTRQLFISAFVIFTVGSLAATLAPNFWVLLLGRVLQAACTGMSMPMVFTVILLVFPREKRGTAMGVIGLIIGFAPAVGPSVAGLLVDSVGWRALFAIVTVLSVIVVVLAVVVLKNYGDFARAPFDKLSVALSTVGLVCLLYGLSTFASTDNMALTAGLIVAGLALCVLYVVRQMKLPEPMLQVSILKARKYAIAVIIIVIVQAALMGTGVITPLYIQGVLGFSATMSGVAMLPGALIGALMGLVSGRLFDRYGVRRVVIPGVIVAVLCNGIEVTAAFNSMWGGFKGDFTDAPMLAKLLNRGGVTSMLNIMCLVVLACGLGGMLRRMGVIDVALEPLAKWANSGFKLVLSTLIVGYGTLMLTAAIYFSIVMTGTLMAPVFRRQGFRSENCSRVVEDASTLGGPLVPWANNALFPMATLGVAYLDYIPYVYLLFLTPCFSLLYGLFNITMTRLSPEEVEEEKKEREGLAA